MFKEALKAEEAQIAETIRRAKEDVKREEDRVAFLKQMRFGDLDWSSNEGRSQYLTRKGPKDFNMWSHKMVKFEDSAGERLAFKTIIIWNKFNMFT
jgi:hypothetical protein